MFDRYTRRVADLLESSDLDKVSARQIRKQIEKEQNIEFGPQKTLFDKFITDLYLKMVAKTSSIAKKAITKPVSKVPSPVKSPVKVHHQVTPVKVPEITNVYIKEEPLVKYESPEEDYEHDHIDEPESDFDEPPEFTPRKKNQLETSTPTRRKKSKIATPPSNTGWNKPCKLSPQLAALLGQDELSRPQVVKHIWAYIKGNQLQDPNDKRYIVPDEKLFAVLGVKRVQFMTMNKHLSKHIIKSEKVAKVTPTKKPGTNGFKKIHKLSAPLAKLLRVDRLPRTQVVKKLWEYIKLNQLQDPKNKTIILNDSVMFDVFNTKSMTMFEMNKLVGAHLEDAGDVSDASSVTEPSDDDF